METIFHEKQEGSLCAQHCLNALLQGAYFTAVDLSTLALRLDEEERLRMAESGEESEEYRRFIAQPSGNMDDSGYFSVQVISSALEVWGLELIPYSSSDTRVSNLLTDLANMQAFICNYKDHWFTIRRIRNQWYNLNSLLRTPQSLSDTYLSLFLAQLKNDGYSIFVVVGDLPTCDADNAVVEPVSSLSDSQVELEKAIQLSLQNDSAGEEDDDDDEATQLKRAIALSLECRSRTPSAPSSPCDPEDMRNRRLAFLNRIQKIE